MKYTFQHFMDISTSASSINMIKIRAGGEYVRQRCKHLFSTYKYWKLGKISVKLIPASTLPVSPGGLAYSPSDPYQVDPRDQLSPGLVRITNGEDMLNDFTGLSDEAVRQMYTATMLDPRWSKFMLQSGFQRSAVPLYWNVGNLEQAVYPDSNANIPMTSVDLDGKAVVTNTIGTKDYFSSQTTFLKKNVFTGSNGRGLFQTGHRGRMGWMPTDAYETFVALKSDGTTEVANKDAMLQPIPVIDCISVILPKAYKTIYYYRLFITETVYFSGVKNVGIQDGTSLNEYRSVDNFVFSHYPTATNPFTPFNQSVNQTGSPTKPNDGSVQD